MPIDQDQLKHLDGEGIIVKHWFADLENKGQAKVFTSLPNDEEVEAWQEAAFTNGGPLVKIEIIWDPEEAKTISAVLAEDKLK